MATIRQPQREPRPVPKAGHLTVNDLMTRDVIAVRNDAPVDEAVARLADSHVTGLAVLDQHGKLVGVVSASDILDAESETSDQEARARFLTEAVVSDVMTARPLVVGPSLDVREAALQMDYADVHRLFVEVDDNLVGVISRSDINRAYASGRLT
jgi:CBS domain-containing protein